MKTLAERIAGVVLGIIALVVGVVSSWTAVQLYRHTWPQDVGATAFFSGLGIIMVATGALPLIYMMGAQWRVICAGPYALMCAAFAILTLLSLPFPRLLGAALLVGLVLIGMIVALLYVTLGEVIHPESQSSPVR